MAATGYTPIQLYYSTTAAAVPLAANLAQGELAINIVDGKLYYENSSGVVTLLASAAGASGDVVGPASATNNALARFDGTTGKLIKDSSALTFDGTSLTFTSTGQRIIADMSNATITNRLAFQTSTTNSSTVVGAIPNGTSNVASFLAYNNSDPTNSSNGGVLSTATEIRLQSGISGTGTYLPLTFYTNGAERGRFDTSGNLGIGTSSPAYKLQVAGTVGVSGIITSTVTGGQVLAAGSGNTAGIYSNFANTGGTLQYGIDNSTGSYIYGNSSNYAGFIGTTGATSLVLATNSVVRMTINSSGNVGIANANPTYKLDLYNVSGSSSGARIYGNDQSNVRLRLENAGSGGVPWDLVSGLNGASNAFFSIYNATLGATALSIDATSNNVGIGATPNTAKLYVYQGTAGNIGFTASHVNGNSIQVAASYNYYDAYNHIFRSLSGTTTYATIDNSGNLGLGVTPSAWSTSAQRALQVYLSGVSSNGGGNTASRFTHGCYLDGSTWKYQDTGVAPTRYEVTGANAGSTHSWSIAAGGTAGNAITFTQAMTLDASGNLGVGVTSPATRMEVLGASEGEYFRAGGGTISARSLQFSSFTVSGLSGVGHQINVPNANGVLTFATGSTERARITAGGALVVGVTSPQISTSIYASGNSATDGVIGARNGSGNSTFQVVMDSNNNCGYLGTSSPSGTALVRLNGEFGIQFTTGGTERARIASAGNFIVNGTSAYASSLLTNYTNGSNGIANVQNIGGGYSFISNAASNAGQFYHASFEENTTQRGSIISNGTLTAYNTTSDYRLKTVIGTVTGHGARIDALKPIDYLWTESGQQARGFLAHEFQEVYTDSVTGTKDAVDANGKPIYQQMQAATSEVIADLVAEIQSLRKRLADAGI